MKDKVFYLKLLVFILLVLNAVSFQSFKTTNGSSLENTSEPCYYEEDPKFILVEKNVLKDNLTSFLYKDNENHFLGKILDASQKEIEMEDLIKIDQLEGFQEKIKELLYLKYPKFISDVLILDTTHKTYLLRKNELVIYFNDYKISPQVEEILYLKVNYNEIKEYLNYSLELDLTYENESGYHYTSSKKSVAITFDDSPNYHKTTKILKSLQDNLFHATFFVLGEKAEKQQDLLISMKNSGNEVGSHTYHHQNMKKLKGEEIKEDYEKMNHLYQNIFHTNLKLLRPPYGSYKDYQTKLIDASFILWSLDTNDWRYRSSDYLINYVVDNIKDGDIILFHDSYDSTVLAIEKLLPILYSKGYQVMSVSELFNLKKIEVIPKVVYHRAS